MLAFIPCQDAAARIGEDLGEPTPNSDAGQYLRMRNFASVHDVLNDGRNVAHSLAEDMLTIPRLVPAARDIITRLVPEETHSAVRCIYARVHSPFYTCIHARIPSRF